MAKDKELSTNDEVQRSKEFQDKLDLKTSVLNLIEELLVSTTDDQFKTLNIKKNDHAAGEYGDGTKYGAGQKENSFIVNIANKTKTFFQKETIYNSKTLISVINVIFQNDNVVIEYKTPESYFFRGLKKEGGSSFMVNEKHTFNAGNITSLKTELKKLFALCAKKEIEGLMDTKLGVTDKTEKSTTSTVEENTNTKINMKKLTLKELYSEDFDINNSDKVKSLNTVDLSKTTPKVENPGNKKLFFDEDSLAENDTTWQETLANVIKGMESSTDGKISLVSVGNDGPNDWPYAVVEIKGKKYIVRNTDDDRLWIKDFVVDNMSLTNPGKKGFKGSPNEIIDMINGNGIKTMPGTDLSMNEITTSGPAVSGSEGGLKDGVSSGAGGYKTPKAWKETPYAKNKEKKPAITRDYKVVPRANKDSDSFWTEVKLKPGSGYVPVGMDQNYIAGMHGASKGDLSKKGYTKSSKGDLNESVKPVAKPVIKTDLTQKKFFSITENIEKGVNKRYLITEKTSDEYQKERWKKLTSFKTYESIEEAETMNSYFETLKENRANNLADIENKSYINKKLNEDVIELNENYNSDTEETVLVEKPGSKFSLQYKFFKKDFLNESKAFILDLNSKCFVSNPNAKK